ncbi:MAG: antibiotic biosynthesis monooxygenase [Chloroflexi bacterium]|nr:antibiotic biosynthesis monooxygenase [Chloroflexota bacterium]
MIARIWRGMTPAEKADAYLEYLEATGLKDYRATEGNRGVRVLRRVDGGQAEFLLISLWDSFEAIHRFAGDDIETAVYYPEDREYLLELEPAVRHYDLLVDL